MLSEYDHLLFEWPKVQIILGQFSIFSAISVSPDMVISFFMLTNMALYLKNRQGPNKKNHTSQRRYQITGVTFAID